MDTKQRIMKLLSAGSRSTIELEQIINNVHPNTLKIKIDELILENQIIWNDAIKKYEWK